MQSSKMQFGHKGLYEYRNLGQNIVLKVRHDSLAVTKTITSYIIESAYTVHHVDRNYCMYCDCTFFTDKCAVLNEQTHNLDSVDCKAPSGCPSQPYIPSVLWQCKFDFMEKA